MSVRCFVAPAVVTLALLLATPGQSQSRPPLPAQALTLQDCISLAFAYNPDLQASGAGMGAAAAEVARASSSYYPQASFQATLGRTSATSFLPLGSGTFAFRATKSRADADLVLRQTFWQLGRRQALEAAKAEQHATSHDYRAASQQLILSVARQYYSALASQRLALVAEEGVRAAEEHLREVTAKAEVGAVARVDISPAEEDVARASLDLIEARNSAQLAKASLKEAIGLPTTYDLSLAEVLLPPAVVPPSLAEAVQSALEHRPELGSSRSSLLASRFRLAQAELERGPLFELTGTYQRGISNGVERDPSYNLLVGVSWPFFDGGNTRAVVRGAQAAARRAQASQQALINQIGLEVEQALLEVARAAESVQASAKSVVAAQARLEGAEGKYREGVGILLEVIDARKALTAAQAAQVQAIYDQNLAWVALRQALGTLTSPLAGAEVRPEGSPGEAAHTVNLPLPRE